MVLYFLVVDGIRRFLFGGFEWEGYGGGRGRLRGRRCRSLLL